MAIQYDGKLAAQQGAAHIFTAKASQLFSQAIVVAGRLMDSGTASAEQERAAVQALQAAQQNLVTALRHEADALAEDYPFTAE